jgi:hypothetical protein
MSNHLSENQFAKYVIGRATSADRQHVLECAECSAELDRFRNTLSTFNAAIRDRIDDRIVQSPGVSLLPVQTRGIPKWCWALVATTLLVLVTLPFVTHEYSPKRVVEHVSTEKDADELMNAVNLHLSRTVAAPMEPMLALIPNDEYTTESGGVQ